MRYYELIVTVDHNDADYLTSITKINKSELLNIKSIVRKISKYKSKDEYGSPKSGNWNLKDNSWDEIRRLHNLTNRELEFISEFIRTNAYDECHTIIEISYKPYVEKSILL